MRFAPLVALLAACARPAALPPPATAPATSTVPSPAPVEAAPSNAPATAITVPSFSEVPIELADDAPTSVAAARFELPTEEGGWREVVPVSGQETEPAPTAAQRGPSFLVDSDQEPLRSMCAEAMPTAESVLAAADARLARKSLAVGIVTASTAAERREGDCTEHAMVAAALLRCHGHAARLVVGTLVVRLRGRWFAGAHMWAERYDHGWRVADATFPERAGEVAHLRQGLVDDEGPSCVRSLARSFVHAPRLRVRVSARPR